MEREKVWREFMDLTTEDQKRVADFISFLRGKPRSTQTGKPTNLEDEPFIGMRSGREDLEDSTARVRETREKYDRGTITYPGNNTDCPS